MLGWSEDNLGGCAVAFRVAVGEKISDAKAAGIEQKVCLAAGIDKFCPALAADMDGVARPDATLQFVQDSILTLGLGEGFRALEGGIGLLATRGGLEATAAIDAATADPGTGALFRYSVDAAGNTTIRVRNVNETFELTEHAALRATQRGISIDRIEATIGGKGA